MTFCTAASAPGEPSVPTTIAFMPQSLRPFCEIASRAYRQHRSGGGSGPTPMVMCAVPGFVVGVRPAIAAPSPR
jgi:hypothetical protein